MVNRMNRYKMKEKEDKKASENSEESLITPLS